MKASFIEDIVTAYFRILTPHCLATEKEMNLLLYTLRRFKSQNQILQIVLKKLGK